MTGPSPEPVASAPSSAPDVKKSDHRTAYISALSALAGALLVGILSVVNTVYQSHEQNRTDTRDFIRTQRQVVYSKAIFDSNALHDSENDCVDDASPQTLPTTSKEAIAAGHKVVAQSKVLRTAIAKLLSDLASVELVGSNGSSIRYAKVISDHQDVTDDCTGAEGLGIATSKALGVSLSKSEQNKSKAERDKLIKDMKSALSEEISDDTDFILLARSDLGVH